MGNQSSSPTSGSSSNRRKSGARAGVDLAAERVKKVVGEVHEEIKKSVKKLDDDHPAAQFFDSVCGMGGYFDDGGSQASSRHHTHRGRKMGSSFYSEDNYSEDESRTVSEDDTYDDRSRRSRATDKSDVESQSYMSQSDYDSDHRHKHAQPPKSSSRRNNSFDTEEESRTEASSAVVAAGANPTTALQKQPLASSFAKRCYFTKAGIGRTTQHYEGLTLTGNVVLMLAAAMKLKGCPTICDEDLRRVEQTYPNQFSRLPDELLLSSGWRRISKYCHFSNKPIPDGVPFFHSKQRLHPSGGYYFLLAAAVGMTRPIDVEPLNRDTLVLLETDYPTQCDSAPSVLIKDPEQWTLVNKFCFFSGGPINTEEDVYYQADFDGNPIYMLAFLSPSLTPDELYKLGETAENPSLKTITAVQEVESVYDLTERDFDDLKLYHLGPCRALPQYILQPQAWVKILPPHFLAARQQAMIRAEDFMQRNGLVVTHPHPIPHHHHHHHGMMNQNNGGELEEEDAYAESAPGAGANPQYFHDENGGPLSPGLAVEFQREIEEEGAFHDDTIPMDEALGRHNPNSPNGRRPDAPPMDHEGYYDDKYGEDGEMMYADPTTPKLDPPDDEPPSLHKMSMEYQQQHPYHGQPGMMVVPDPEDPSVLLSPDTTVGFGPDGRHTFFPPGAGDSYRGGSPSRQYQQHPQQNRRVPLSPDDEQQQPLGDPNSNMMMDDYDEDGQFVNHEYPQDEFGGFQQQQPSEEEPSVHYRPRPPGRALDPLYTDRSPTHSDLGVTPAGAYYASSPRHGDPTDYVGEEKKVASSADDPEGVGYNHTASQDSNIKSGEEDFIPIKRDGYKLSVKSVISPHSVGETSESGHQSPAFRGAQELLRKNRRRRLQQEESTTNLSTMKKEPEDPPESLDQNNNPASPSNDTWDSTSDVSGSNVSGSSLWSEGSGNGNDRSSRRALILQMAKARMRGGASPTKSPRDPLRESSIDEEEAAASVGGHTETHTEIDMVGDLD